MKYKAGSLGQSYIEMVISLLVLLPLLLMLPTMANLLSVQTEAHKASRYVAWEQTAYPIDARKLESVLGDEVEERFIEAPRSGFGDNVDAFRSPWRDFYG